MILAIDATAEHCSAALSIPGRVLSRTLHAPREHTQKLLAFVDSLLVEAGVKLCDIGAVAFGAGPGSFTGLRIAAAMAQGLALGANKPVLPISSLRAVAFEVYQTTQHESVMVALDARKSEVYWGLYGWNKNAGMVLQGEEIVVTPSNVPLPDVLSQWVGAGNGFAAYSSILEERMKDVTRVYPNIMPQAHTIAVLAEYDFAQGKAVSPELGLPTYVRNDVVVRAT